MLIKKDFILLILNCYKYREKAIKQKNTWLNKINKNITYFHILGDKKKCGNKNFIIDQDNNIIYVNTKDDYVSLPSKIIYALEGINSTYLYKYIFKTDDDQYLTNHLFFDRLINKIDKNTIYYHYGGFVLEVDDHISNDFSNINYPNCLENKLFLKGCNYSNGRFYFLSHIAVKNLLINKNEICKQIFEDHTIGLYLDKSLKKNILYFDSNKIFIDFDVEDKILPELIKRSKLILSDSENFFLKFQENKNMWEEDCKKEKIFIENLKNKNRLENIIGLMLHR